VKGAGVRACICGKDGKQEQDTSEGRTALKERQRVGIYDMWDGVRLESVQIRLAQKSRF
jgi:hypothetical protein